MVTELCFPAPGWKVYYRAFSLSLLGAGFIALGLADLSFISWRWSSFLFIAGGVFSFLLGIAILLLIWFTFTYGTINIWRRWRQLRQPTAVINATGIRFLAVRRPALVPWQDVEEVRLDRDLLPGSIVTKVSMRLMPSAELVRNGPVNVPGNRYLNIGLMSDLDIPEDVAQQFLADTAGPRLRINESDHRTPSATHGYG